MASDCMLQKSENNAAAGAIHSKMSWRLKYVLGNHVYDCLYAGLEKKRKPPLNVPKYWK